MVRIAPRIGCGLVRIVGFGMVGVSRRTNDGGGWMIVYNNVVVCNTTGTYH